VQPPAAPAVVKVPKIRDLKEVPLKEALEPLEEEAELEEEEEEEEEPSTENKGRGGDEK
jgi:hypothetical protein